jgi:hypothetical protein
MEHAYDTTRMSQFDELRSRKDNGIVMFSGGRRMRRGVVS